MADNNLIGRHVLVLGANYFYAGILESEAFDVIWLAQPSIVYETGEWSAKSWKRAEKLPMARIRIERSAIESIGEIDR